MLKDTLKTYILCVFHGFRRATIRALGVKIKGGTQDLVWTGVCAAEASEPTPMFRGQIGKKGTHL